MLKPAERSPVSALVFAHLMDEAGFPPGVFNVVAGDGDWVGAGRAPGHRQGRVHRLGRDGRVVAQAAAHNSTGSTLELGGKSAQIVFHDADLEAVTNGIVAGVFAAAARPASRARA